MFKYLNILPDKVLLYLFNLISWWNDYKNMTLSYESQIAHKITSIWARHLTKTMVYVDVFPHL